MPLPAARHGDPALCAHGASSLDGSNTSLVEINHRKAVTIGSLAGCAITGSSVISGAGTVFVNQKPAARATDRTTDGSILIGSGNVFIGGPTVGMAGAPDAQKEACKEAAKTRANQSPTQSHGNCGLESWRNLINKERAAKGQPPLTEDELLSEGHKGGWAGNHPGKHNHGASNADGRVKMLEEHGIPAETQPQSVETIEQAVREGKGVSASVHPYWHGPQVQPDPDKASSWLHEVAVTGVEYDGEGKVVAFIVNDTALRGGCGKRIPVAEFDRALEKREPMTVTKKRAW